MTDTASTPRTPSTSAPIAFTADDALTIVNTIGALVSALVPGEAAVVAAATGAAALIRNTVLPAIQHFTAHELSVVEQAALAAESAAERLRVGAPPATEN